MRMKFRNERKGNDTERKKILSSNNKGNGCILVYMCADTWFYDEGKSSTRQNLGDWIIRSRGWRSSPRQTSRPSGSSTWTPLPPPSTTSSRRKPFEPADPPSITDGIKRLMNQRNHAHLEGIVTLYRSLRIIREIKLAKNNFYPCKLQQLKDADSSKRSGQIMQLLQQCQTKRSVG